MTNGTIDGQEQLKEVFCRQLSFIIIIIIELAIACLQTPLDVQSRVVNI